MIFCKFSKKVKQITDKHERLHLPIYEGEFAILSDLCADKTENSKFKPISFRSIFIKSKNLRSTKQYFLYSVKHHFLVPGVPKGEPIAPITLLS